MRVRTYGMPSFSKDRQRAQVVVLVGEGQNQRSATRHVQRMGFNCWLGFNPDPRAIPLNAQYEAELQTAQADLTEANKALMSLRGKLVEVEAETPETIVDAAMLKEMRAELEDAIGAAQATVSFAESEVDEAETKLAHVRRELPLQVEFYGPGL